MSSPNQIASSTQSSGPTAPSSTNLGLGSNVPQVNAPVASANWLQNITIRSSERAQSDRAGQVATIPRTKRNSLGDKERTRLIESMTHGLSTKFAALDLSRLQSETAVCLEHTASLAQQLNEVETHLRKFDLLHVFTQFPKLDFSQSNPADYLHRHESINLLDAYDTLEIRDVVKTVEWMRAYMDDELLNELTWTHSFLHQSCETVSGDGSLYNVVAAEVERFRLISSSTLGGPVTLMIILSNIVSSSKEALKLLQEKLRTLKVTDYQGENIATLTTQLTYVIRRLRQTELPQDLSRSLLRLFQTSSNEEFNSVFKVMDNLVSVKVIPEPSWDTIFERARDVYTRECNSNRWFIEASGTTESVFRADHQSNRTRNDHKSDRMEVPQAPLDEWTRRPSRAKNDTFIMKDDKKCWKRTMGEKVLHWCGRCSKGTQKGRWTTGDRRHFTCEHVYTPRPTANVADDAGITNPPPEDETQPRVSFSSSLRSFAEAAAGD